MNITDETAAGELTLQSIIDAMVMLEATKIVPPPIRVFGNRYMTETVQGRFPRCNKKKRRITKRFQQRYTREVPSKSAIWDRVSGNLYCHPEMMRVIKDRLQG